MSDVTRQERRGQDFITGPLRPRDRQTLGRRGRELEQRGRGETGRGGEWRGQRKELGLCRFMLLVAFAGGDPRWAGISDMVTRGWENALLLTQRHRETPG